MAAPRRLPDGGAHRRRSSCSFGLAVGTPTALLFLSTFLLMTVGTTVDAHGYLMSPRSRNFLAHSSQDGVGYGGTAADPKVDYEPQSLNRGGLCGARSGVQYTFPENAVGGPMPLNIQATYEQGQEVVLEAILTAHHWGHIEVKACPLAQHGDAPTQECFDQFPLLFVNDLIYPDSPNDPDYPGRAYIPAPDAEGTTTAGTPTGKLFRQKFKLPSNLNGQIVLLQWYYRTGNSCSSPGYDKYFGEWGSPSTNLPTCPNPVDSCGEGAPEQFWNCAEITITNGPGESPTPTPPAGPAELPCSGVTGPSGPMSPPGPSPTTAPPPPPPPPPPPGPVDVPFRCGMSWMDAHTKCGVACATGNSTLCPSGEYCYADLGGEACTTPAPPSSTPVPPTPIPPTPVPPTMQPPSATPPPPPPPPPPGPISLEDSDNRMIAYLGNWQTCPTPNQIAEYTHIVIAFAVTYTWNPTKNQCRQDCSIGAPVPICENANRQDLVDQWRAMGKKVILSFGGAGMGGSWAGDNNDCWEYCYGKQQYVVDQLNTIVRAQNFDGVDIDYEYFYNTQAAQDFLHDVTVGLKTTLPANQNIVTHAPMEPDCEQGTAYYNILKNNAAYLDFLMPQYYNGFTRPALDGLSITSGNALPHYNTLVNDMFGGDATKVIFGFCISDCSGTGSNASGQQAASVMTQLHSTHSCNGGAFFWVVTHDTNGDWSNKVNGAISASTMCDAGPTSPPAPTKAPAPTNSPTSAPPSSAPPPPPPPPPTSDVELVASGSARCGTSELDAREMCGNSCTHAGHCPSGTACYATHPNYCGDPNFTPFQWVNPVASTVWARCGKSEVDARSFCKPVCNSDADCPVSGERCYGLHQNYCGSQVAGGSRMLRGNE